MLHEAEVRRQFEAYFLVRQTALSERRHFPAKVLFVPLAGEAMGVIRDVTHEIDAPALDGEYLVIPFDVECPFVVQIVVDKHQMPGERRFVRRQQHDVVGIAVVVTDFEPLFDDVVELGKIEVCEKLA